MGPSFSLGALGWARARAHRAASPAHGVTEVNSRRHGRNETRARDRPLPRGAPACPVTRRELRNRLVERGPSAAEWASVPCPPAAFPGAIREPARCLPPRPPPPRPGGHHRARPAPRRPRLRGRDRRVQPRRRPPARHRRRRAVRGRRRRRRRGCRRRRAAGRGQGGRPRHHRRPDRARADLHAPPRRRRGRPAGPHRARRGGRHLGAGRRRRRAARPDGARPLLDPGRASPATPSAAAWACSAAGTASPRTTCAACASSPPTGAPHEIDADRAPELYWALRGAGRSGFGVVTELEFALFPLARLYGGGIVWPGAAAADVLHAWREWAPTLPDDAGTSVALLRVPRDAGWPAPLHDRTVVHVRFAGADVDAVTGDALLAPMRALGSPAARRGRRAVAHRDRRRAPRADRPGAGPRRRRGAARPARRGRRRPARPPPTWTSAGPLTTGGAARAGRGAGPARRGARRRRGAGSRLRAARAGTRRRPGAGGPRPGGAGRRRRRATPSPRWSTRSRRGRSAAALPTFAGAGEPEALWSPRDRARLHLLRRAVDRDGMFAGPSPA